jgi:hypothetical protein
MGRGARGGRRGQEGEGACGVGSSGCGVLIWVDFIAVSIQFEYDPDELATRITTQLVHKSNSKPSVQ